MSAVVPRAMNEPTPRNIPGTCCLAKIKLKSLLYPDTILEKENTSSVLLLGSGIAEIPLNIFIGGINGRQVRPSVRRK